MQSKAEMMGNHFQAADYSVKLFSEEALRGTLFFSLSMILKKIDPHVRNCAHLGNWLIISQGRSHGSRGYVTRVKNLYDVMHKVYDKRTVLLVDKITGEEEVPDGVQAIVVMNAPDYPDVLAHVSVRARNLKVLLTVNFDQKTCDDLASLEGRHLLLKVAGSDVKYEIQNENQPIARRASSHLILQGAIDEAANLEAPPMFKSSLMYMTEFSEKHSGGKSNNLKALYQKLPTGVKVPDSACIPFQVLEYTLGLYPDMKRKLNSLCDQIGGIKSVRRMNRILNQCKDIVMSLSFKSGDKHLSFIQQQLSKFGIPDSQWDAARHSIKRVWASKFNERAFLATKKLGVSLHQIFMAVLVQKIVPAEYAYVIHSTNPTNSNDQEVYAESCVGLGEALVSDMPGQALAFSYDKITKKTKIMNYPNKSLGLSSSGFIFRSDSNSEDLPGFAGAGLFDSYTMHEEKKFRISYNQERLVINEQFRDEFMRKVGSIGHHIETVFDDEPQDIEGAYYNGEYYVVQTRPQV